MFCSSMHACRYYATNQLKEKSDVYTFGVVLLELITGQPPILVNPKKIHIVKWVNACIARGDAKDLVDQRMEEKFDMESVWKAVDIAMECVKPSSTERPSMSQVVIELKNCFASDGNGSRYSQS